jgi:hypothetical protein
MRVALSALFLLFFSCSLSAAPVSLENYFDFDGYFNVGANLVISVTTKPLSSEIDSITLDHDGGLVDQIQIPFTLFYPAAPAGAQNVYAFTLIPTTGAGNVSTSYVTEPVVADCGGAPCNYQSALFAPDAVPMFPISIYSPSGEAFEGPDAAGKSFDLVAVVTIPIPVHPVNPGYNAKTTITISGPTHYDFRITAVTLWDGAEIPEPSSIALAGLGLVGVLLARRCR